MEITGTQQAVTLRSAPDLRPNTLVPRTARLSGTSADVQWFESDLQASTVVKQMTQAYITYLKAKRGH
jgi:hypothetical protein